MNATRLLVCLAAPVTAVLIGCGPYTMKSQYRTDVRTVFVPIWTRGPDVYRRELEFRLTEAVQKQIELDTPYKITSKDRADTELRGKIVKIEQRILSKNPDTGLPRELEETFVLAFTWEDLRTGKVLRDVQDFRVTGTYVTAEPLNEGFFEGSEDVINRAARRIVETMEDEW